MSIPSPCKYASIKELTILKKLEGDGQDIGGNIPAPSWQTIKTTFDKFRQSLKENGRRSTRSIPHEKQPQNMRQLRDAIVLVCESLEQHMIHRSFDAMVSHAKRCIRARGHAFSNE